jgi:hypothetical protein
VVPDSVAARVEDVPPRLLLPHGSFAPERLDVIDALPLPQAVPPGWLVLASDASDVCHVLPVVDDGQAPRRARTGDGWFAALVAVGTSLNDRGSWSVRAMDAPDPADLMGALSEDQAHGSANSEVVDVDGVYRVRLALKPQRVNGGGMQPWRHIAHSAQDLVAGGRFDLVWTDPDGGLVGPLALVSDKHDSRPAAEVLNRYATGHLRGLDTASATLSVATALGETLARVHHALATPSAEAMNPTSTLTSTVARQLERHVKDVLSEALVLTDPGVRETLQGHMADLRGWFAELARAEGAVTLPAVPLGSLEQFIDLDGRITLDPLLVQSGEGPHLAVMDIATLLREVTHVAHGALRRLVSGGDDVPAERVPTWVGAVRETLLERYEATLAAYGNDALFDRRLLRAFEIEAECRALIYASRELPTWSSVPDAGLLELLSPW